MSRVELRFIRWTCDRCGRALKVSDNDQQPAGWIHTQDGRDLCPDCQGRDV